MKATVIRAGFSTTIQDLGRAGFCEFGVSLGGGLDRHALRVANLLVGNSDSAAGLEITFGGLQLRFVDDRLIAWCGGEFDVRVGSMTLPPGHVALARAGQELILTKSKIGCRSWLAISGGIDVPLVLGSRSTDQRGNFGGLDGQALHDGAELPLNKNPESARTLSGKLRGAAVANWSPPHDWCSTAKHNPVLRFTRGVDWNRFDDVTIQRFANHVFAVSPDSDRMGVRFDSPELKRTNESDLISEAVAPGTVQVPPSGRPILLLGDCQTIGGYPKIAHVITVDFPVAAQLRGGDRVRFREISLSESQALLIDRGEKLEHFRRGIQMRVS
jgi:antagonist of KipI